MLYELWRTTARRAGGEWALLEASTGHRWTFRELSAEIDRRPSLDQNIVFPRGNSPEFIFAVLTAWRDGRVLFPLEAGQAESTPPLPPGPCLHLKATSATTGRPRLVAFTGPQLIADTDQIVTTMGLRPEWPNMGIISMAHSYGFSNLVLPLLLRGIPLVLAPSALPEAVRAAAAGLPALTLPAVPAMWKAWHDVRAIPSSIQLAISAAAPLPISLEQAIFERHGLKVHNFYGSTECGGIAYDADALPRTDASCAGTPMHGVALDLDDQECLTVRSPAVGETYWPESEPALRQGVFQTSDLAELRDGQVRLRGRLSDQINVAGRKLSPEVVEQALLRHQAVADCVVFGLDNPGSERAESVAAVVVSAVGEGVLKEFLLQTLPAWQIPRHWRFVDSLPAGTRGKISRVEWRRRWESGELRQGSGQS